MGLPVVAFDSGGVKECFIDGKSGFSFKQRDHGQAASRVLDLIKSPIRGQPSVTGP